MLAVTPSKSREVALIANPEFEAGRVAGVRYQNPSLLIPLAFLSVAISLVLRG